MKITIYTKEGDYHEYESPREVIIAERKVLSIESSDAGFFIRDDNDESTEENSML